MSLAAYQDALAALLTDRAFRDAFLHDPAVARRFALDEREFRSLAEIGVPPMVQHADLLEQARVMLALKALPVTARLLGGALHRTIAPFCAAVPPQPGAEPVLLLEARRFAAFLRSDAARPLGLAPHVAEVAAYEATSFEHGGSADAWEDATRFAAANAGVGPVDIAAFATCVPVRGAHARIASFACDAPGLVAAHERGETVDRAAYAAPCTVLLVKRIGRRTPDVLRIGADVRALLERCDGRATGAEIAHALGASDALAAVHRACETLRAKNVLVYRA